MVLFLIFQLIKFRHLILPSYCLHARGALFYFSAFEFAELRVSSLLWQLLSLLGQHEPQDGNGNSPLQAIFPSDLSSPGSEHPYQCILI